MMIHSDFEGNLMQMDGVNTQQFQLSPDILEDPFLVHCRPGLFEFLAELKQSNYDVRVFTAGERDYATPILDWIEQQVGQKVFNQRYFRDSCTPSSWAKDLAVLGLGSLGRVVLVDNNPRSFAVNPSNGRYLGQRFSE